MLWLCLGKASNGIENEKDELPKLVFVVFVYNIYTFLSTKFGTVDVPKRPCSVEYVVVLYDYPLHRKKVYPPYVRLAAVDIFDIIVPTGTPLYDKLFIWVYRLANNAFKSATVDVYKLGVFIV